MQFSTVSFAALAAVASSLVSAETASFGIMNTHSASKFHFTYWGYDTKGNVDVTEVSEQASFITLKVQDDTSVQIANGKYLVVDQEDYAIYLGDKESASTGFTIGQKDGALVPFYYKGSNSFTVCPNSDGNYVIYSASASGNSDLCVTLTSWAVGSDGETLPSYNGTSSSSA